MSLDASVFQVILDEMDAMITLIDAETFQIVYANAAALEVTDAKVSPYVGCTCYQRIAHADHPCPGCVLLDGPGISCTRRDISYGGRVYRMTYTVIDLAGRRMLMERSDDITEQARMHASLEANQKSIDLASRRGNISVWTLDLDKHRIIQQVYRNGHMDYPIEIDNVPAWFLERGDVPEQDAAVFNELYQKMYDGAPSAEATFRLRSNETGEFRWMHLYYEREQSEGSNGRLAYGFALDVTVQQENLERFRAERDLRFRMYKNTIRYYQVNVTRQIVEEMLDPATGVPVKGLPRPLEGSLGDLILRGVPEQYHSTVRQLFPSRFSRSYQEGQNVVTCVYRRQVEGKGLRWVRGTSVMGVHPFTNDLVSYTYIQDIDVEKKRELALNSAVADDLESVTLFNLAEQTLSVVKEGGPEGEVAAGTVFADRAVFQQPFVDHTLPEDCAAVQDFLDLDALVATLNKEGLARLSFRVAGPDGRVMRKELHAAYLDDSHEDIVFTRRDTTLLYNDELSAHRRLEEAVKRANDANEAKTEFFSRMSHDMRTPMNGILGLVALSNDETDAKELRRTLAKVGKAGDYLLGLINDTLDFQRIESGKMTLEIQTVKTTDLLTSIIDMVKKTAEDKGVALRVVNENTDLDWYVRVDPLRMRQIFVNLLSNAIKFTPTGGMVEMNLRLIEREGMISHDVIAVRDTGIGMSPAFLQSGIFKPFSQEANDMTSQYAGSGLGLSIVKSLVELMGGRIEVTSEPGSGTTFLVYLDFERVENDAVHHAADEGARHADEVRHALEGKRILLAEDNRLNAEIATRLLQKVGCLVTWAPDGAAALDSYRGEPAGFFDAILMDIRMPVMNGLDAARAVRASSQADAAAVPIIAMTANAYPEDMRQSVSAGMNAYLTKPVAPDNMYETIARCLEG